MRDLILEKKAGFMTSLPFNIVDNRGIEFYTSDFTDHIKEGKTLKFNLPAGIYKYDGSFVKLWSTVPVNFIMLPPRERNIEQKTYKIEFNNNPNKCTIFYKLGVIVFDYSFMNEPLYVKYSIYFHELGHHYYKTEYKADFYACKKMLDFGFNPSQIGRTALDTLSNKSFGRKVEIVKLLTNNEG